MVGADLLSKIILMRFDTFQLLEVRINLIFFLLTLSLFCNHSLDYDIYFQHKKQQFLSYN